MNAFARIAAAAAMAAAASYGTVLVSRGFADQEPAPVYGLLGSAKAEGWLQRRYKGVTSWVGRHPALTGTVAGCVAGSWVPVIGTVIGCATGATIGATIGSDERSEEKHDREVTEPTPEATKPPEAHRAN